MSVPLVSVVIPTFRRPEKIRACLEALAKQTIAEPWEVVVVDDGSPEPIAAALPERPFGLDVRILRQENAGPATARNRGVREARGRIVAFTDDDCQPEPAWLETLVRACREREHALVGGTTLNGLPDELFPTTSQLIVDLVYEHFNADPERSYFLASNNIACHRASYLELGGFDPEFPRAGGEDRDFCDQWRSRGWPIVWRPEARIVHRHPQSLRTFINLHVRYGRGAYRYQAARRERASGTMKDDLEFHATLPHRARLSLRRLPDRRTRFRVLVALGIWQIANAIGFAAEALNGRVRPKRSA